MTQFTPDIQAALASEFDSDQVGWKPQVTTKGKSKEPIMRNGVQVAGCTAHIDARAVMNRLDDVVGVGNWSDDYIVLPNGKNVQCTLTVFGVSKSDVGEPNDGGFADAMKAAYSDALKRAAVKFGIGRYLYDMEMEWLPFDGYRVLEQPRNNKQPQKQAPKQASSPAPTWGETARYGINDEVMVKGKDDEKPGTVLQDEGGDTLLVRVGKGEYWIKRDRVSIIKKALPLTE